jgi:hypothetical protein
VIAVKKNMSKTHFHSFLRPCGMKVNVNMQIKWQSLIILSFIIMILLILIIPITQNSISRDAKQNTAVNANAFLAKKLPVGVIMAAPSVKIPPLKRMEWHKPAEVKGVYTTGWIAGSTKWFPRLIKFIDATEVNALVVDIKNDTGNLSFPVEIPLARETGAAVKMIADPAGMIQTLKEHRIYPIARIVVFKDPYIAKVKPEWAVKSSAGGLWRDRKGLNWVDPHNKLYWDYIIAIAKEAVRLGFQEIQFDYVRFTSDGNTKTCIYPFAANKAPEDVIQEFLQYARTKLAPCGIPISADIFGLTTSADADLGIGQRFEKIVPHVDVVCPMVYPSHYIPGNFGLKNPNAQPYRTVFNSVSDAKKRLTEANSATQLRPWLQDFSLGVRYGRSEIQSQIKAVNDVGIKEWIFWNPSCRYSIDKYR